MKSRLCRPPEGAFDIHRWTGRKWIEDDGKPGLAFSYKAADGVPCAATTQWPGFSGKTTERAMNYTVSRWSCSNGKVLPAITKKK
jgi:hypothetical protein